MCFLYIFTSFCCILSGHSLSNAESVLIKFEPLQIYSFTYIYLVLCLSNAHSRFSADWFFIKSKPLQIPNFKYIYIYIYIYTWFCRFPNGHSASNAESVLTESEPLQIHPFTNIYLVLRSPQLPSPIQRRIGSYKI